MAPPDGTRWVHTPCQHTQRNFLPTDYYDGLLPRDAIEIGYQLPTGHILRFINCGHPDGCRCFPRSPGATFFPHHPVVVASDGGVRPPLSSIGVFVGEDSQYNVSELMAREGRSAKSMRQNSRRQSGHCMLSCECATTRFSLLQSKSY